MFLGSSALAVDEYTVLSRGLSPTEEQDMATYGDMLVVEDASQNATSGAIFALGRHSPADASLDVGDGWTVEVRSGSGDIVARGGTASDYAEALASALSYAQRGLDLLSFKGTGDLTIIRADDQHEAWWLTPQGVVFRYVLIRTTFNVDVPPVTVTVTDSAGNVKPDPPPPPTAWHPSFQYYRLAQATDDLFDAYRNIYLAFESILDTIEPMRMKPSGKPGEGERAWLLRVLGIVNSRINLADYAPSGTGAPADRIVDQLYQTVRTAIFHARGSKRTLMPGEATIRQQVDAARKRLVRLYLALSNEYLHLQPHSGAITSMGFHQLVAGGLDTEEGRLVFHLSDESDSLTEGRSITGSGKRFVPLVTRREQVLDGPFVKSFLGEVSVADLGPLPHVQQIVATNRENEPLFSFVYDHPLTVAGLLRVEVHIGLRARNVRQPKELYGM